MLLAPPLEGEHYDSLKSFVKRVNQHAGFENYAIVIARFKVSKKSEKRKTWLRCDRKEKIRGPERQKRLHTNFKLQKCFFKITAKRIDDDFTEWMLIVKNLSHNYDPTLFEAHFALRKLILTKNVMNVIKNQNRINVVSIKIFNDLRFDINEKNFIFKTQNIYNAKTELRRKQFECFISVQALMLQLKRKDWTYNYEKNNRDQIIRLFFFKDFSKKMLQLNHKILIIDCIYKTNRFKMPLLVITDQINLNITFYVDFAFIAQKNENYYTWVFVQLRSFYQKL